jgi:hypothetical protein
VLYTLIDKTVAGKADSRSYAWYLRVPDLTAFFMHIRPVLDQRMQDSGAHRFTGELTIDFFDLQGLRLTWTDGKLTDAERVKLLTPQAQNACDAGFPWQTFLHVLFGYRSVAEIGHILPEAYANRKATVILDALFPRKPSLIWAL